MPSKVRIAPALEVEEVEDLSPSQEHERPRHSWAPASMPFEGEDGGAAHALGERSAPAPKRRARFEAAEPSADSPASSQKGSFLKRVGSEPARLSVRTEAPGRRKARSTQLRETDGWEDALREALDDEDLSGPAMPRFEPMAAAEATAAETPEGQRRASVTPVTPRAGGGGGGGSESFLKGMTRQAGRSLSAKAFKEEKYKMEKEEKPSASPAASSNGEARQKLRAVFKAGMVASSLSRGADGAAGGADAAAGGADAAASSEAPAPLVRAGTTWADTARIIEKKVERARNSARRSLSSKLVSSTQFWSRRRNSPRFPSFGPPAPQPSWPRRPRRRATAATRHRRASDLAPTAQSSR